MSLWEELARTDRTVLRIDSRVAPAAQAKADFANGVNLRDFMEGSR
jgi:hypothetical protein